MMIAKRLFIAVLLMMAACGLYAQQKSGEYVVDYVHPKKYIVGGDRNSTRLNYIHS